MSTSNLSHRESSESSLDYNSYYRNAARVAAFNDRTNNNSSSNDSNSNNNDGGVAIAQAVDTTNNNKSGSIDYAKLAAFKFSSDRTNSSSNASSIDRFARSNSTMNSNDSDADASHEVIETAAADYATTRTFKYRPTLPKSKPKSVLQKHGKYTSTATTATANNVNPSSSSSSSPVVTAGATRASLRRASLRLSAISKLYDLDGDGILNSVEQAMRNRDITSRGYLTTPEVKQIVNDYFHRQKQTYIYKKIIGGLVCLVAILALSNLGTSFASVILVRDVVAESSSGTIVSDVTGEVMGFQNVAHTVELIDLTHEEFEERRLLVDTELLMNDGIDYNNVDHAHRLLGKKDKNKKNKKNKNDKNNIRSKVAYDQGKIHERDLEDITRRCEGGNTVNIERHWRRDRDAAFITDDDSDNKPRYVGRDRDGGKKIEVIVDSDSDTICGPGTTVIRKGKKKRNRNKTKVKVVDEQVTFRKRGMNGRDKSITFDCKKGSCYASGGALLQSEGHPCRLERDQNGASECEEDLACYDPDGADWGVGVCTRLQQYAKENQICQLDFGVDACEAGYACYTRDGRKSKLQLGMVQTIGVLPTGKCQRVTDRSAELEVCDLAYGDDSCEGEYICRGVTRAIRRGIGYCQQPPKEEVVVQDNTNRWYVNYSLGREGQCINDGKEKNYDETFKSPDECCEQKLGLMDKRQCAPTVWS